MSKGVVQQTSWNILIGMGDEPGDLELFFGDVNGDVADTDMLFSSPEADMIDILVMTGVFRSNTDARKNGWGEDREPIIQWKDRGQFCVVRRPGRRVPKGFTLFRAGKGKATEIAILNIDTEG